jgi:hypothetical protein
VHLSSQSHWSFSLPILKQKAGAVAEVAPPGLLQARPVPQPERLPVLPRAQRPVRLEVVLPVQPRELRPEPRRAPLPVLRQVQATEPRQQVLRPAPPPVPQQQVAEATVSAVPLDRRRLRPPLRPERATARLRRHPPVIPVWPRRQVRGPMAMAARRRRLKARKPRLSPRVAAMASTACSVP